MPWNSVVRLTDRPDITIAVYRGRKAKKKKPTNPLALSIHMYKTYCKTPLL